MVEGSEDLNRKLSEWLIRLEPTINPTKLTEECTRIRNKATEKLRKEYGLATIIPPMAENAISTYLENRIAERVRALTVGQPGFNYTEGEKVWKVRDWPAKR